MRCSRPPSACRFRSACRSPDCSPRCGASFSLPGAAATCDYLAIVTLAFGELSASAHHSVDLTNGCAGISNSARIVLGIPFTDDDDGFAAIFHLPYSPIYRTIFLFYLILALALLTNFVTIRLRRLPIGRAWRRSARTRSPAAHWASTPPPPSYSVRARRNVRRLRRFVLRGPAGIREPGELHLHEFGYDPGHRDPRRHGLSAWRRDRRGGDDQRAPNSCANSTG